MIAFGWEGARGYYAVLFVLGKPAGSRGSQTATRRQARLELLEWAVELGFFEPADFDEATAALDTLSISQLPKRLRTLVDVMRSFDE